MYTSEASDEYTSDVDSDVEVWLYSQLHYEQSDVENLSTTDHKDTQSTKTKHDHSKMIVANQDLVSMLYNNSDNEGEMSKSKRKRSSNSEKTNIPKRCKVDRDTIVISDLEDSIVIDSDSDVQIINVNYRRKSDMICATKENIVNKKKERKKKAAITLEEFQKEVIMKNDIYCSKSSSSCDSESDCSLNSSSNSDYHMENSTQDKYQLITNIDKQQTHNKIDEKVVDKTDKWAINEQDAMSGICHAGERRFGRVGLGGRYFKPSSVKCHNCKEIGHPSKDCPKPKKNSICIQCGSIGHYFRSCPRSICYRCNQPGHNASTCSAVQSNKYSTCTRCLMPGHSTQSCPDFWRQFHLTTSSTTEWPPKTPNSNNLKKKKSCSNCGSRKHFHFTCRKFRMDQHSLPTYTLVAKYNGRKLLKKFFDFDVTVQSNDAPKKRKQKEKKKKTEFVSPLNLKVKKNKHKSEKFMKAKREQGKFKKKKKRNGRKEKALRVKKANGGFHISKAARRILSS